MAKYNDNSADGRSIRVLQVGEQIRHVLSDILARGDIHDELLSASNISITEVRMSPDLRHATVFFKPFLGKNEKKVQKALADNAAYLRGEIAKQVRVKYSAALKFLIDESFDESSKVEQLLSAPKVAQDIDQNSAE